MARCAQDDIPTGPGECFFRVHDDRSTSGPQGPKFRLGFVRTVHEAGSAWSWHLQPQTRMPPSDLHILIRISKTGVALIYSTVVGQATVGTNLSQYTHSLSVVV